MLAVLLGWGAAISRWRRREGQKTLGGELPIYSVLVPLYREAAMVRQISEAVLQLDWPREKLDVQLLIEADDRATLEAADKLATDLPIRVTRISGAGPRTKPNALNIGLQYARGAFVTIFDAEDHPHPRQLRAAYERFQNEPDKLAALQAPLIGTSLSGNWISAQWSLDYAVNFGLLLPAYSMLGVPIALGGTSNHLRVSALQNVGGWDAWNVTEDADLGIRLARFGYTIGMIWTPTYEAAPDQYPIWLLQRVRWIKGFLMTWLVLMRRPGQLSGEIGLWRLLTLQLTFGAATFSPFIYAPATLLVTYALWSEQYQLGSAGWSVLLAGLFTSFAADCLAPGRWSFARVIAALTRPLYWPLLSVAAYGALIGLVRRPTYWAKTPHQPS